MADVSEFLKEKGKDKDTYSQRTYDLSRKSKITKAKSDKMVAELKELGISRMSEEHIVNIIDLLPKTEEELKMIFSVSKTTIKPEDITKMLEIVKKYAKD